MNIPQYQKNRHQTCRQKRSDFILYYPKIIIITLDNTSVDILSNMKVCETMINWKFSNKEIFNIDQYKRVNTLLWLWHVLITVIIICVIITIITVIILSL